MKFSLDSSGILTAGILFGFTLDIITTMSHQSDSSQESQDAERRSCLSCNTRMSSIVFDKHSVCSGCRGQECDASVRCEECSSWSPEFIEKFAKHQKSLVSKSKARKQRKDKESEKPPSHSSLVLDQVDQANGNARDHPSSGVSEDRVKAIVAESMSVLTGTLHASLAESFSNMEKLIADRDSGRNSNPSVSDSPVHPPVRTPPCQGHEDPSLLKYHTDSRKSGVESMESEGVTLATTSPPPFNINLILSSFRSACVQFTVVTLDLAS